jgi:hypothetical protein
MDTAILWHEYARLQKVTNRSKVDAQAWAFEEQANEFLTAVASETVVADGLTLSTTLKNLASNRRRKHVHRQVLLHSNQALLYPSLTSSEAVVIARMTIESLRNLATPSEWRILEHIALGDNYRTIAAGERRTVAGIKSLVSRCRSRLKSASNR